MAGRSFTSGFRGQYDSVVRMGNDVLGLDVSVAVNLFLVLGAISAFFHYAGGSLRRWAMRICVSSVHINEDDNLYAQVMRWMVEHHLESKRFRSVKATTPIKSTWEDEEEATRASSAADQDFDVDKLISYRSVISRVPIKLAPFESTDFFRHNGRWIFFRHSIHKTNIIEAMTNARERGFITLQCLGRSLEPLRELLDEAQQTALDRSMSTTNIFRGLSAMRDRLVWMKVVSRPSRDIRTVILDKDKKRQLLADINEYLHPRTRRWYANHGIPYRRGYLFSGAPGTGKTSLTAALAGVFGLDIYVLSLLDPQLSESQLMRLLSEVPSRCIVLLEDVDAAGLNRAQPSPAAPAAAPGTDRRAGGGGGGARGDKAAAAAASKTGDAVKDTLADAAGLAAAKPAAEISLSGLLNAIDGVSSHEGRILVMTTNAPEALDRALIRPGRVDMHVAFALPKRPEIRELFLSMYRDDEAALAAAGGDAATEEKEPRGGADQSVVAKDISSSFSELATALNGAASSATTSALPARDKGAVVRRGGAGAGAGDAKPRDAKPADPPGEVSISSLQFEASAELGALADTFAAALPEAQLSLAAIQGYLLRHKRDPRAAVRGAGEWADEMVEGEEREG